ncbi:MAG: EutN/CcmL family microcompartment protein [Acidobacteria bacterium]|nr:EutN/CcmL family microcompartment protein [Acidobacteriota bacterium]
MILAKVVGTVVATRKDERLVGSKLLLVQPVSPDGEPRGAQLVAVDTVDAGAAETVLIVSGSSARMAAGLADRPVDAAIVGLAFGAERDLAVLGELRGIRKKVQQDLAHPGEVRMHRTQVIAVLHDEFVALAPHQDLGGRHDLIDDPFRSFEGFIEVVR